MGNKNYGFIKPEYLKPELSTKLYHSTHRYLLRFYSENIFEEACSELGMPIGYLMEDDNWVSVEFGAKFAQLIREKTGDPEVYRKIGHFYFSPSTLSPFEYSLLKSLSPYLVLKTAEQFYRKRNAVCNFKLSKVKRGTYKFEMTSEKPLYMDMAQNTLGILEAFQKLYNLDLFSVNLDVDNHDEIHHFTLTMRFAAFLFYLKRILFWTGFMGVGFGVGFFLWHTEKYFDITLLPVLTGLFYLFAFLSFKLSESLKIFRTSTEEYYAKVREKNLNVYEKSQLLERRYQEATLLKKLSAELVSCTDPHRVIETCLRSIKENFGYKRAAVFLISKERGKLYLANSIGFENLPASASNFELMFPNPDKQDGFIATVLEKGQTTLILDVESYKTVLKEQYQALLNMLQVGSLIISPIQSDENKFGAFVLIRDHNEQLLGQQDKFLVENVTSQLSLYFESASNYENEVKLKSIFKKYVPKTVLDQIGDQLHTSNGSLAPRKTEICSVFMDLRGFTSACDGVAPERAFALINLFADFATKHLADQGAIIDNIIGDEIVAFFPKDPAKPRAHVESAAKAAFSIQQNFPQLTAQLKMHGFPNLRLGIGIHSGEASVGSVGSDAKMNFTALGSTVNIASRLQSLTKKYPQDVSIIFSAEAISTLGYSQEFSHKLEKEILRGTSGETNYLCVTESDLHVFDQTLNFMKKAA